MSDNHLISRPIILKHCHGCHAPILAAMDAGLAIAADPQPLDITAEITAVLSGRATYDIVPTGTSAYLIWRDMGRVKHRKYAVIADHACLHNARPVYRLIPPKTPARKKPAVKAAVNEREVIPF